MATVHPLQGPQYNPNDDGDEDENLCLWYIIKEHFLHNSDDELIAALFINGHLNDHLMLSNR